MQTGTPENITLTFTIPRGATGADGADGTDGVTPTITAVAETGEPDTPVSVVQTGTPENITLTFTIPRGATGADATITPAAAVADVEGTPTPEEVGTTLNALLASLRAAGFLAES